MLEKGMPKVYKMMPKGSQNESQNPSKIAKILNKKACRNWYQKSMPKKSSLVRFFELRNFCKFQTPQNPPPNRHSRISEPFWSPFWVNVCYDFACLFKYWFTMDILLKFQTVLSTQNHVFYCKTNSFERFCRLPKTMKFQRFWHHFWYHFGSFWHYLFIRLSAYVFIPLGKPLFGVF